MARQGVSYENVKHAAMTLLSQGITPSVQKVREILGTGSNTTLAEHLAVWREEQQQKSIVHLPASLPKELIASLEVLWQTAMDHAENQLSTYKRALEEEQQRLKQMQIEVEKNQTQLQQQLNDIYQQLEVEKNVTQVLRTENAVLLERLTKNESLLAEKKYQYEERIQRIYTEKDTTLSQNSQLQQELKLSQEKLEVQASHHQAVLLQQQERQEQSENRWLKLIDQAREETKITRKKLEVPLQQKENEVKQLKQAQIDAQQELYDTNARLKIANDSINKLTAKIQQLEKNTQNVLPIVSNTKKRNNKSDKSIYKKQII
jgi:myosin heavy subunit